MRRETTNMNHAAVLTLGFFLAYVNGKRKLFAMEFLIHDSENNWQNIISI